MVSSEDSAWDVPPSIFGTRAGGPTVQRLVLGRQLHRLRESRGISAKQAAEAIRGSHSKISRMELGRVSFKERDVIDLLEYYGITDLAEREKLIQLTREANATPWYQKFQDVVPDWFHVFVGLEEAAQLIRVYEVQFVPGLLQTEEYARAIILQGAPGVDPDEVERRVALRMGRQKLLTRPGAPELWAVLDEAALRRSPDGPEVMRAQLQHLLELTDLPNVTLQIVPFRSGPHAAAGGPFTILRFPEPDLPDVVYLEQLNSALYLDQPADVIDYVTVMDQLCVQAATGAASKDILRALLRQA